MKTIALRITMQRAEGALVRLLGLIGRRGFELRRVAAEPSSCGRLHDIRVELSGTRCPSVLERQLAKLYDVRTVERIVRFAAAETPVVRLAPATAGAVGAAQRAIHPHAAVDAVEPPAARKWA